MDIVIGNGGLEQPRQFADVASDAEFEHRDLAAVRAQREDRCLPRSERRNVDAACGAHDRVGDAGVADEDFLSVLRQIDDHRAADAELQALESAASDRDEGGGGAVVRRPRGRGRSEGADEAEGETNDGHAFGEAGERRFAHGVGSPG